MSFKRLSQPTGVIDSSESGALDTDEKIIKSGILVHTGPDLEPVTFMSSDGETKPFDEARLKNIVKVNNALFEQMEKEYGGKESTPLGAYPPLLDQHEGDSNNRIKGRLVGNLKYEVRDIPKVGKNCGCVVSDNGMVFLGKDTVVRVKDGRIYHLSIGIDEANDTLGETSTVIEPAAAGAMLLQRGKKTFKGETKMAMKKLSKKKLQAASQKRLTKLSEIKESLTKLVPNLKNASDNVKLAARQRDISGRLVKLCAAKKLTPAERTKIDVKKLSALDDASLETMLGTFEAREDVIMSGQRGTGAATGAGEMAKEIEKKQWKRMKSETRAEFKRLGAKMKEDDADEDKDQGQGHEMNKGKKLAEHEEEGDEKKKEMAARMKSCMSALSKHLEEGNVDEAKKSHKEMSKCLEEGGDKHLSEGFGESDVKSEDEKKAFDHLQSQVDELNTNLARMAGMVDEMIGGEKEEGKELEGSEEDEGGEQQ